MTSRTDPDIVGDERISDYGRLVEAQRRLYRIFDRSLRRSVGMSAVWYEALLRLARSPERHLTMSELGEALQLTSGGATRLVDRLVERGYVERVPSPTDRRVLRVRLTDAGGEALSRATEVHLEDLDEHFASRLTSQEMDTLRRLLRRIRPEG